MRIKTSRIPRSTKPKEIAGAKLEITYVDAASLIPYAKNARTHSEAQIELIRRSLLEFGWTNPVLLDGKKGVIAGHGRLLAAAKIWEAGEEIARCPKGKAPCIDLHDLTAAQKRAYILADNQLALTAGWDADLLAADLGDLKLDGFDLSLIGFDDRELVQFMAGPGGLTDQDEVPPAPVVPVSRAGDLWVMGAHRLLCGDSTRAEDVERLMGGAKAALVWTDPPYGVGYSGLGLSTRRQTIENDDLNLADLQAFLTAALCAMQCAPGCNAFVCHADAKPGIRPAFEAAFEAAGFTMGATIIWVKQGASMGWQDFRSQHEPILFGWRSGGDRVRVKDRSLTTVWNVSRDGAQTYRHPTQKPVALVEIAIKSTSAESALVLDPFVGSGTTIIAAEMTGRVCYALEIAPQYVDVSVMRWMAFTGKDATLEGSGKTFNEVSAERLASKERIAA